MSGFLFEISPSWASFIAESAAELLLMPTWPATKVKSSLQSTHTQLQACKYLSMQTDYAAGKVKPDFAATKLKLSLKSELCSNKHLQLCAIYGIWW